MENQETATLYSFRVLHHPHFPEERMLFLNEQGQSQGIAHLHGVKEILSYHDLVSQGWVPQEQLEQARIKATLAWLKHDPRE